jgi:hypothetical protein
MYSSKGDYFRRVYSYNSANDEETHDTTEKVFVTNCEFVWIEQFCEHNIIFKMY